MKIGLVRHFKVVDQSERKWMFGKQFNKWVEQYNESDIQPMAYNGQEHVWDLCWSSDLSRAAHSAQLIHSGDITYTDQLREIDVAAVPLAGIKLHYILWLLLGRMAWHFDHHSQPEGRTSTIRRAKELLDLLESNDASLNVLIVSHGVFMHVIVQELRRRGYKGASMINPRNGEFYIHEKVTHNESESRNK